MSELRLSKLQKTILATLSVLDEQDKAWYENHCPTSIYNISPYWHDIRNSYNGDGTIQPGLKSNVERVSQQQKGVKFRGFQLTGDKVKYYQTPFIENSYAKRYRNIIKNSASSYSVSFSRALRTLLKKRLIEARYKKNGWDSIKFQIDQVRLTVNNLAADINNNNL